jgi:hypothetical protein
MGLRVPKNTGNLLVEDVLACQEDFALELVGIEYDLESSVCP